MIPSTTGKSLLRSTSHIAALHLYGRVSFSQRLQAGVRQFLIKLKAPESNKELAGILYTNSAEVALNMVRLPGFISGTAACQQSDVSSQLPLTTYI
jgi:hypothetical protein